MIDENGRREIDVKRYARFEKVPHLLGNISNALV